MLVQVQSSQEIPLSYYPMIKKPAQNILTGSDGNKTIENDWYHGNLPKNIILDDFSYPDTAYSFSKYHSEKSTGFTLGYGSGNYGHSNFIGGRNGKINIGKFVVLQGMNIICNLSVIIKDHCMFSWGSLITDSWLLTEIISIEQRKKILAQASESSSRNVDFMNPQPVVVEENVWVGFKALILPGVTLGRGCVIGSNSVITKNIPPYAVVAGNPSKILRYLDPTDTDELKKSMLKKFLIS